MARVFNRGELKVALLSVIASLGEGHGYAIMQELQQRVGSHWRPSPGAIYPALVALEEAGAVTSEEREGPRPSARPLRAGPAPSRRPLARAGGVHRRCPHAHTQRNRLHPRWAAISVFLFVIWLLAGGDFPWFIIPVGAWGIVVVAHAAFAFVLKSPEDILLEREQQERERARNGDG